MPDAEYPVRDRVLDALTLIHLAPDFMAARPEVPGEIIAYAVCQYWFDQVFEPGIRYVHGLKGDRDSEAAARFVSAFDEEEWSHIERFHRFLELRIDRLDDEAHRRREYPVDDSWIGIVRDAGNTVELLGANLSERATRLRRFVGRLADGRFTPLP
jgi:hypothetical protein